MGVRVLPCAASPECLSPTPPFTHTPTPMSWWEAIVLGLVQGLAEFLPISSSGHLVLGQYLLGINEPDITFEVFVHFGTTLSILTVYWARILCILRDGLGALTSLGAWKEAIRPGKIERARVARWALAWGFGKDVVAAIEAEVQEEIDKRADPFAT